MTYNSSVVDVYLVFNSLYNNVYILEFKSLEVIFKLIFPASKQGLSFIRKSLLTQIV